MIDLKEQREIKGLSVADMAKLIGVKRQTIYHWEKRIYVPNAIYVVDIMKYYNITARQVQQFFTNK